MPGDEWTLVYPGVTYTWGSYASGVMLAGHPDMGDRRLRVDDVDRPRADGRAMGVDHFGGQTITFEMLVLGDDEATVRQRKADLSVVWRADAVRSTPGAVAELRTVNAGRERVAYGRPRRFAPVDRHTIRGVTAVVADFEGVDDCWYGPTDNAVMVGLVPPPSGGLVPPLAEPLTTTPAAAAPGAITVVGDLPAWPVITFYGPVTMPAVTVTGLWTLSLALSIPAGQSITVDTRPWRRTVLRPDGASFAGALTRSSPRLSQTAIPLGTHEVVLRGVDVSGTAQMRFAWRSTYAGL